MRASATERLLEISYLLIAYPSMRSSTSIVLDKFHHSNSTALGAIKSY